jgi:hypothetical protein
MYLCIHVSTDSRNSKPCNSGTYCIRLWDHSVSIATRPWVEQPRNQHLILDRGKIFFSLLQHPKWVWSPPTLLSRGALAALTPEVKRPGCETDHAPPSSAKVRNVWSYNSTPLCMMLNTLTTSNLGADLPPTPAILHSTLAICTTILQSNDMNSKQPTYIYGTAPSSST